MLKEMNGKLMHIPCEKIMPNPAQPRKTFDRTELIKLSESIAAYGVIQPLTVRKSGGLFELISGERRLRASKQAGLTKVPCYVLNTSNEKSALLAMIENLQRKDLDFFEEAEGIEHLIKVYSMTQEQVAKKIGKSQSAVANKLRLLRLGELTKILIRQYNLTERHARALLKLDDERKTAKAVEIIVRKNYNVAQTEHLVEEMLAVPKVRHQQKKLSVFKDVRIFLNSINKAIDAMKDSGINAISQKSEDPASIVYTITIPK